MSCQSIVNSLYKPNSFRYLELGIGNGSQFKSVNTIDKVAVDINGLADYNKGTDKFFENYKGDKFDVIFIDANHEIDYVVKDYNNSLKLIKDGGFIFIHDLFPPDERHSLPLSCGDGYKLLNHFLEEQYQYGTIIEDFGLTILKYLDYYDDIYPVEFIDDISYADFSKKRDRLNSFSEEDMISYLKPFIKN